MSEAWTPGLARAARQALDANPRRVVIVGAGGWIGKATLALLADALGDRFSGRVAAFGSSDRELDLGNGLIVPQRSLDQLATLPREPSLLLHLAFLTKDKVAGMAEDAYVAANVDLSGKVMAALDPIGVDRLFVASSGAARHADDPAAAHDLRLYGRLKRDDEERFAAWAESAPDRASAIARIFSLSGPYINKHDTYALADFILHAQAGRTIEVKAPLPVYRSYVAIRELMSLIFAMLLGPSNGVVHFDTGGTAMELGDVAQIVADELGGSAVKRAAISTDGENRYVGDDKRYSGLLAQHGIEAVPFTTQVHETAAFLARQ